MNSIGLIILSIKVINVKVKIFDKMVFKSFLEKISIISALFTIVFIFVDIPTECKTFAGLVVAFFFLCMYLGLWWWYNRLKNINIIIEGSTVEIKTGDIFEQSGFKVIAFNEYFDTQVDDKIISKESLNGIFIEKYSNKSLNDINHLIDNYQFDDENFKTAARDALEKTLKGVEWKPGTLNGKPVASQFKMPITMNFE